MHISLVGQESEEPPRKVRKFANPSRSTSGVLTLNYCSLNLAPYQ